jgi:hypothetical protein
MAKYRVLETSYIGDRIVEAGTEVEFDHDPGFNVEPLDGAARKRVADYAKTVGKRLAPTDPGFTSSMMRRNLDEGDAKGMGVIPASPMGDNAPNALVPPAASAPPEPDTAS